MRKVWAFVSVLAFATAAACGGGQDPAPTTSTGAGPSAAGMRVDPSRVGNVSGKIMLNGTPPAEEVIRMNSDPVCMREAPGTQYTQYFIVDDDGGLHNVFVYVKEGLGNYTFDAPAETAVLDQQGCRYIPHVFGVRVGQPLEILNSDPTLHNVHAQPRNNREFNTGQPIQGMKFTHTFTAPEVMVPFKCDVHGWMNAYAGVVEHPYFAVTGSGGQFELAGLPPGDYVIEAWHEKLGTQTMNVTVTEGETADANFSFDIT